MSNISLSVCDYCKSLNRQKLHYNLSIREKGKRGIILKAEICDKCYAIFNSKISDSLNIDDFPKFNSSHIKKVQEKITKLDDGATIIPSKTDYKIGNNTQLESKCSHDRNSLMDDKFICQDCGEETPL